MANPNRPCVQCGMPNVSDEFHPLVLCRLVEAHGGDMAAARSDLAFVLRAARTTAPWTRERVNTFLRNQAREGR